MKYLILNGNPSGIKGDIDRYIESLALNMNSSGYNTEVIVLRELNIKPCIGCFNCWIKTPGICSIRDDAPEVSRKYIAADHVILASPLIAGFLSCLMKNTMDRNIPLVHPHLEEIDGEVHHKKRYDRYPIISFLLEKEAFTDEEDIAIASDIFCRQAINVRASVGFIHFTETPVQEVIRALDIH